MRKAFVVLFMLHVFLFRVAAQPAKLSFDVVPLGVKGGLDESNLSAYLIAPAGTKTFICADAGTIRYGIDQAIRNKVFNTGAEKVLKTYIKGYLVSHAHLDHVSGLLMNSPDDTAKNIYAFPYIIQTMSEKYFTWQNWANFANEGDKPALNKYHYVRLAPNEKIDLDNTAMSVTPFVLSHSAPYESSAFLLEHNGNSVLYLGDTGADSVEGSDKLASLWQYIAPAIKSRRLKGIFIEVSFPDEQPDKQLFGHLTPKWFMQEMHNLSMLTGTEALKKVNIAITHIKPAGDNEAKIRRQLAKENTLGLHLIYPVQGKLIRL